MPDDRITDAKDLLKQVSDFGDKLKERRRHERKKLLWAAKVEVRGQRFEGMIIDLSAGGARIRFDAPVATGDELTLVLKQLDDLGAKVVWQRQGEAGLQFMLAPEEVAARLKQNASLELAKEGDEAPAPATEPGPVPAPAAAGAAGFTKQRLALFAAIGILGIGLLTGGSLLMASALAEDDAPPVLALVGGASDQRSCANLLGKVGGSTNQVDFSLNVASAVQAKCLDMQHLGSSESDHRGHMVSATKVPLH